MIIKILHKGRTTFSNIHAQLARDANTLLKWGSQVEKYGFSNELSKIPEGMEDQMKAIQIYQEATLMIEGVYDYKGHSVTLESMGLVSNGMLDSLGRIREVAYGNISQ